MSVTDFHTAADLLHNLSKEFQRMRMLIIDQHSSARNSLRIILSTLGVSAIHSAATSAEVLRQVKAYEFDVIFADYLLSDGRDGQQLLEELRQQHFISLSTVFMLVTAERNYRNVVSVAELTPDDYLVKPFTAEQLQNRLAKALHRKRFLEPVFRCLDTDAYTDALAACIDLEGRGERYGQDILRCKGDILNALGRYEEAQAIYRRVLERGDVPWAQMGLAIACRGLAETAEAERLGMALIESCPEYLSAYDFVAGLLEEQGKLGEAQEMLLKAAALSPNNSLRQRTIANVAARNNDLEAAERAYGKVLERHRGSSLRVVDDYTNLTRVMLQRGHTDGARRVVQDLRRDWRGDMQGEVAALIMDSLCASQAGESAKAKQALDKALSIQEAGADAPGGTLSQKIAIDLAHACLANAEVDKARRIVGRIAAENHEDRDVIAQIEAAFADTGHADEGRELLAEVGREIVELNELGVQAAHSDDPESSLPALIEAAERVHSVQFLTNASKAIFSQLSRKGWNEDLAERGERYLRLAQAKDARHPLVIAAREMYVQVARNYGIEASSPTDSAKRA